MGRTLVIAGGKTGGHLFPGISVAEEFAKKHQDSEVYFIGVKGGIEERVIPKTPFKLITFDVKGFEGKGIAGKASSLLSVMRTLPGAARVLKSVRPMAVLGVGSFSSIPTALAARMLRISLFIHEQNSIPGKANMLLSRFSKRVFASFKKSLEYFPKDKTSLTGNPVREKFLRDVRSEKREDAPFTILFLGGSQGARSINRLAVDVSDSLEKGFRILHQTGERFFDEVKGDIKNEQDHEIFPFSEEIGKYYARSHLVVCRAGASTIFELSAAKRASILIPLPTSARNHQYYNALEMKEAGGAVIMEEKDVTWEKVLEHARMLRNNPDVRSSIEERASSLFREDAPKKMVEEMEKYA